ncbi:MAG TPA: sigma-E factor negative regulatory protein [Albitalea sp.]|nr:sigma-E factor negative regulatory protein [Albitalea sp.]
MSIGSGSDPSALECLSALSDGELDSTATGRMCGAWREDASLRSTWHAYHLIGDVLRSDDLASDPRRDADFLRCLRERLSAEPTVLAPEPFEEANAPSRQPMLPQVANGARSHRWSWMAPSAVAAGFVLVAGALIVTRAPLPTGNPGESLLARAGSGAPAAQTVNAPVLSAAAQSTFEPQALPVTGKVIRDSRLDRYLAAHQQFAGTTALGVPSGFLRNAAAEMPNR